MSSSDSVASTAAVAAGPTTGHFAVQPFRPVFLLSPGRPPVPWGRWHNMFEDWLLAVGFPDGPSNDQRKAALLRASLGTEGYRLYNSLTPEAELRESYDNAVTRLKKHFGQPASDIFARAQFTRCQQRQGQNVTQYVATLREMAAKCNFNASQLDERVRDQFVAWVSSDKIRERLLQESATKSLDDLLQIAITVERAMSEAPALALSSSSSTLEASVGRIHGQTDRKPRKPSSSIPSTVCWNCGQEGHTARSDTCPARGKTCRHCGKTGHYLQCCRQRKKSTAATSDASRHHRSWSRGRRRPASTNCINGKSHEDDPSDVSEMGTVYVGSVETSEPGEFRRAHIHVNSVPITLMIDLGAKVSIISKSFYDRHLTHVKLRPAIVKLRAYQGQRIDCLGCVILTVEVKGKPPLRFRFHVTSRGESLLGLDLFDALGGAVYLGDTTYVNGASLPATAAAAAADSQAVAVNVTDAAAAAAADAVADIPESIAAHTDMTSSSVSLDEYPVLLKDGGTLRSFVHKPKIDSTVRPVQQSSPSASSAVDPNDEDEQLIQTVFGSIATPVVTLEAVAAATDADDVLRTVRDYVINGWPNDRRNLRAEIRIFFDVQHELSVCGRCLIRDVRTVIPASLTAAILDIAHEGHPGIVRMKQRCRETVWWPGIDIAIERYVRDCEPCILSGKSAKPRPGPLQPIPLPSGPWRKLSLDIAGEFVAAPHHQRYVIVATDVYSKWPEVAACGSPTSSAVIEFLTSLFDRFGLVEEITTDNGVQFVSSEFEDFLAAHSIKHSRSALYSPQTNAAVERLNRVIKEGVKVALAEGKSFMTGLRQVMAAYRTTPHATTGVTPASLMLAFPVRTPLSVLSSLPSSSRSSTSSQTDLRKRVCFKQSEMAKQYNQRHRAAPTIIKPGDSVRILLPTQPHKLARVYSEPRLVDKVKGNTVWLRNGQRWNVRRCLLHCSVLKQPPSTSRSSPAMTHAEHAGRTIDSAR
jgi:transposase InsO family protein